MNSRDCVKRLERGKSLMEYRNKIFDIDNEEMTNE